MENKEFILPVSGVILYEKNNKLVLSSVNRLYTLNSSLLGDGFHHPYYIVNQQVDKDYHGDDPRADLIKGVEEIGLPAQDSVAMMTAALVKDAAVMFEKNGSLSVTTIATAGTSNAMAAGGSPPPFIPLGIGTINLIILIDGHLTPGGMVNAAITATEGKTMSLQDLKIKDMFSGEPASGTSTDALVIAATGRGEELHYAGTATELGGMIGRTVRRAVTEAIRRYFAYHEAKSASKL